MRNIGIPMLACTIILLGSFNELSVKDYRIRRIVVDAGHGGKDPGTHGEISREKDIALMIALKFGRYVEELMGDVEVIYTRSDDRFITLNGRTEIANKNGADLFVSVHCNWLSRPEIHGTETYVMGLHKSVDNLNVAKRENSVILLEEDYQQTYDGYDPTSPESHIIFSLYQSAYLQNSLSLATKVEEQFKKRAGRRSKGVKQAGFWVLWKTSMPSILVETGYLSNVKEEKDLNDELKQDYIASAIFRAFRDYKKELDGM